LWDSALVACPVILRGHEGRVASVAFSPDGRHIVSGSYDKTVRLWDAVSYELEATLTGHAGHIFSVTYSPDGGRIASASGDSTVRLWDADSGDLLTTAVGQDVMHSVVFSPDGAGIVAASWDGTIRLCDAHSGDQLAILQAHEAGVNHDAGVNSVAISPDGTCIASGGYDDGTVKFWDPIKGELRATHVPGGEMLKVSFSPNGESYLVASPREAEVKLCSVDSGEVLAVLAGHEGGAMSATFDPAGTRIFTGSLIGVLRIWDAVTAELLATFAENDDEASIVFSPDGRFIASAGFDDNAIHVWDGTPIRTRENAVKSSTSLMSAPDH
jgi:WD40 repeat protein